MNREGLGWTLRHRGVGVWEKRQREVTSSAQISRNRQDVERFEERNMGEGGEEWIDARARRMR